MIRHALVLAACSAAFVSACASNDESDSSATALASGCAADAGLQAGCVPGSASSSSASASASSATPQPVGTPPTAATMPMPTVGEPMSNLPEPEDLPGPNPFGDGGTGGDGGDEPEGPGGSPVMAEPVPEPEPMFPFEPPEPEQEPTVEPAPDEPEPVVEPEDIGMTDAGAPVGDPTEVPDIEYCAEVSAWEPAWSEWEEEVLVLVNEYRAQGADCGAQGTFEPAGPLSMDPLLRCTARAHSLDMYERGFFDHDNPDGDGPGDRLDAAGYMGFTWGENIAQGYRSPEDVVAGWMESDGHCSNIMAQDFTLLGVGYYPGNDEGPFSMNAHYWTQNFGAEQRMFGGGQQ